MIYGRNKHKHDMMIDGDAAPGVCDFTLMASLFSAIGTEIAVEAGAAVATEAVVEGGVVAAGEGVFVDLVTEELPTVLIGETVEPSGLFANAFANLSAKDIIGGAFSGFSALSSIASGQAAAAALESQAEFENFKSTQELLKGQKQSIEQLEQLNRDLEASVVQTAASGRVIGEGSGRAAQLAILRKGQFELDTSRRTSQILSRSRLLQGNVFRSRANAAQLEGFADAAGTLGQSLTRTTRRG